MDTLEIHRRIKAEALPPEQHDFVLHTDGSGYIDGFGGYAGLLINQGSQKTQVYANISSFTSVDHMELQALLHGLEIIADFASLNSEEIHREYRRQFPVKVYWISDRENAVLSVYRPDGLTPLYSRNSARAMWRQFSFYEEFMRITPIHFNDRNESQTPEHSLVDLLASEGRVVGKEWMHMKMHQEILAYALTKERTVHGVPIGFSIIP